MMRFISAGLATLAVACMPALAKAPEASWSPKAGDVIRFDVLRKGNPFGTHSVSFDVNDSGHLIARTEVALKAGIGPITLFQYKLSATEEWQNGELVRLKGAVNDDGKRGSVKAVRDGDMLDVSGSEFDGQVAATTIPASHWNFAQTAANHLLSTEDGEILDVAVSRQGVETIRAGGQMVEATRYLLDSDIDVTLWYDEAGRWLKLAFVARGQDIEYVLKEAY